MYAQEIGPAAVFCAPESRMPQAIAGASQRRRRQSARWWEGLHGPWGLALPCIATARGAARSGLYPGFLPAAREDPARVDDTRHRIGLRQVAPKLACDRMDVLRQQAEAVAPAQK